MWGLWLFFLSFFVFLSLIPDLLSGNDLLAGPFIFSFCYGIHIAYCSGNVLYSTFSANICRYAHGVFLMSLSSCVSTYSGSDFVVVAPTSEIEYSLLVCVHTFLHSAVCIYSHCLTKRPKMNSSKTLFMLSGCLL